MDEVKRGGLVKPKQAFGDDDDCCNDIFVEVWLENKRGWSFAPGGRVAGYRNELLSGFCFFRYSFARFKSSSEVPEIILATCLLLHSDGSFPQ